MKHVPYFNDFLRDVVNLNQSRLDQLNGHVDAVENFLKENLDSYIGIEPQGSYGLKTIIKPVKDTQEYDADIQLYMTYEEDKDPKEYISDLHKCFLGSGVYKGKVHRKTRCVTLNYAGDCHLDIVPCITEPCGCVYVCNRKTNELERTDGTGFRNWFNEKTRITDGNLKRVTRLLKFLRNHKGTFTAKSILFTTLIGNEVYGEDDSVNFKTVPDALKTISNRISDFLQDNEEMPEISNPVLPEESFNRHWDQTKYENFRKQFCKYNEKINDAIAATDHDESVDKWRDIFGDEFGEKRNDNDEIASKGDTRLSGVPAITSVKPKKPYSL